MTPHRLGLLVIEDAASAGQNIATELRRLNERFRHEVFSRAAALADAGRLSDAVSALGAPGVVARAASQWPLALQPARTAMDRLSTTGQLESGLWVLASFCLLLGLVQLFVGVLLASKVMPVFSAMAGEVLPADPRAALRVLLPIQGVAWLGAIGAVRWARSPWNRDLELAAHATVAAALIDSKAPAEVVMSWLASEPRLRVAGASGTLADDLRVVADSMSGRADASMRRFLAFFRFVAFGLLAIEGAWIAHNVLVTLSTMSGAFL